MQMYAHTTLCMMLSVDMLAFIGGGIVCDAHCSLAPPARMSDVANLDALVRRDRIATEASTTSR